jgi:hypothetical protein
MAATGEHSVCPNTMVKGAPSFCSNQVHSAAGTVEPPEQIALTEDRIGRCEGGMFEHRHQHGRYADHRVAAIGRNISSTRPGSNASSSTWRRGLDTAPSTQQTQPPVWNSGMVVTNTSPGSIPMRSSGIGAVVGEAAMMQQRAFRKASGAEVYWIITGSAA